jgi:transposase
MELSNKNWKLAFCNGEKLRYINVAAGNQKALRAAIAQARVKLGLATDCPVYACYEAGRDGFWIHRCLSAMRVQNLVVDPASIEVNRRKRQLKTDRLDAEKLVRMLMRYWWHGEKKVWKVVVVPDEAQEDMRRVDRETERLRKERGGHLSRIRSLLILHGVRPSKISGVDNSTLHDWQGQPLPADLQDEIRREQARLELLDQQIKVLQARQLQAVQKPATVAEQKAAKLARLKGIGPIGASVLSREVFGWRTFRNRREVGAMAGLTGTAYNSGDKNVEQGISKAGNRRVRFTMIEMAWMWTRCQPDSQLTQWFQQRFGSGGSRLRRIGIVALARKLLVALWKYVEFDEVPAGAKFTV